MFGSTTLTRLHIDPRTKLLLLLVCNALVLGMGSQSIQLAIAVLTALLLLIDARLSYFGYFLSIYVFLNLIALLPTLWSNPVTLVIGLIGFWLARFAVTLSLAAWFISTTKVSELIGSLNQLHTPRFVVVPIAVIFRFIPAALQEFTGVIEAMRLRGFTSRYLFTRPLVAVESLLVPFLSSVARLADQLSAAALIRGLGAPGHPTTIAMLRFRIVDLLIIGVVLSLIAAEVIL